MTRFITAVEHNMKGLTVNPGCLGAKCEYAEGDENHQCEGGFSWSECDSCGTVLGGDRYPAYGIPETGDPIELSICSDCLMFHANGEEPEDWRVR